MQASAWLVWLWWKWSRMENAMTQIKFSNIFQRCSAFVKVDSITLQAVARVRKHCKNEIMQWVSVGLRALESEKSKICFLILTLSTSFIHAWARFCSNYWHCYIYVLLLTLRVLFASAERFVSASGNQRRISKHAVWAKGNSNLLLYSLLARALQHHTAGACSRDTCRIQSS